jgi:hypothetical protein
MKIFKQNLKYFLVLGLVLSVVFGRELSNTRLSKTTDALAVTNPAETVININNIAYWIVKDGGATIERSPNGTTVDYPKGTGGLVYEDGIVWGAKVSDDGSQRVRVGGNTYYHGTKAGKVLFNSSGDVIGSEQPSLRHAWRVRRDYKTADLEADAATFFATSSPTEAQVADVFDDYEHDWNNWPAEDGAPFDDVDGDGAYDPTVDVPGYPGADQTVWVVANDVPLIVDANGDSVGYNETTLPLYGAEAIGIELQMTLWAYNFGPSEPLGNIVFKNARLIYTGLPGGPADAVLDTMYITQWSDPDLGTYTDDYVGSDVDLSLGYVYNGNANDGVFNGIYGLPVPAGGYDFLQGPITADGDTLGMTSFTYFGAGSSISDPDLDDYNGSLQFFNLMEGFLPRPEYPEQTPWTDLSTGEDTKFVLSGDPVTGTGWVDGVQLPPGDRRLVMTSGPYEMALGDTQDVVVALIGGHGQDNISSVTVLKFHDQFAQYAYDNKFVLPSTPATPKAKAVEMDGEVLIDWSYDLDAVAATEDVISQGFEFEGYNVYQLPLAGSPLSEGKKVATYDRVNLVQTIFDPGVDATTGFIVEQPKQQGTNSGIKRYFTTDRDALRGRPMSNGITYYFAITAYSFLAHNEGSPFKTLESSPIVVSVTPHTTNPGVELVSGYGESVETVHTGTAGGDVSVQVINQDDLNGHDYVVFFDKQHYYRDLDGVWQTTNYADSVGRRLAKSLDCSGSSFSAAAIASADVGTIDLTFTYDMVCGDNWVDGFKVDLPDGFTVNSWTGVSDFSYGAGSGQNEVNMAGTLDAATNTITWGDSARSGFGAIERSQVLVVNVDAFTGFPFTFDYEVWDDGYDGTIDDASGTSTVSELGYEFKTINHWNLYDATDHAVVLEDQYVLNGVTQDAVVNGVFMAGGVDRGTDANPIVDGFQMTLSVGYAAPQDYNSYTHTRPDGSTDVFSKARALAWYGYDEHGKPYVLTSYMDHGWSGGNGTAASIDAYGYGSADVNLLQRDLEVRFTGEYDATTIATAGGGTYHPVKDGTGSLAILYGARGYDLADHPDPNNPGDGSAFFVRIPFEVWDMEADGGPRQVSILIYDRMGGDPTSAGTTDFYAFNPADRMYTEFLVEDYATVIAGSAADFLESNKLTWNIVWWNCDWTTGDVLYFLYDNPIQQGTDQWTFSTSAPNAVEVTQDDIDKINVYPNPYYGFQPLETSRSSKYVSFNHLPQKADIRIFNLGGVMVRHIKKDDDTQFARWNLLNQYDYPVASGVYIVHIETDFGEKILKLALVQETQVLKYY